MVVIIIASMRRLITTFTYKYFKCVLLGTKNLKNSQDPSRPRTGDRWVGGGLAHQMTDDSQSPQHLEFLNNHQDDSSHRRHKQMS